MSYSGVRRKVFISHYGGDRDAARRFIDKWSGVFIPKQLGIYTNEDFINSNNVDYVMSQIRSKYLGDSTVTIVLVGTCTHSRRVSGHSDPSYTSSIRSDCMGSSAKCCFHNRGVSCSICEFG